MSHPSPPSPPTPEAAAAATAEREQGLFPCTASIKEVQELCAGGEPIPVVSSDVVFVSAWVVLARVSIAGREHGLGFALAGVQGPHAALSAGHLSTVQGWLRGRPLHVHIEHHAQFPYYLYGDLAIGAAGAAEPPVFLSELLLKEGLARFVSHSRRLAALAEAATGAAWERRWTREPSLVLHGRVTRVLAGDVVELSEVAPVGRDALPFHCPLAAWVGEGCKGLSARGVVRVCLENVRCPRVGGRGAEAYAIECAEATRLLAIRQRVRVEVTSAWRNVEELQEVSVELEDSAHLRGAIYLPLEGLSDRLSIAVAPTAEKSQAACNAYLAGGGDAEVQGAREGERSLGVFLSALAYPASVYPSKQTEPWAELLTPEDAMCPLSGDQACCLRARADSGLAAYTRQLAFYNEGNPRMAVQETSLKWACDRGRLLPPLQRKPLEGIVVEVRDDVVWSGSEARGGEAWRVVRATVEVRLLDVTVPLPAAAAAPPPQPQPASPKRAADAAAEEETGGDGDAAVVVDNVDLEVMEDEEDAREQLTQKELEREQAADGKGDGALEQNVERRIRFDVLILPEEAAAAADGGKDAAALLADAARVSADTAAAAAAAGEVAEQLNARVRLAATAVVGGKHTFFGAVSVQAFEGVERPVQTGYRRARTLLRRAHDEGVTVGDRARARCKKSVAAFLAREEVAEPAKLLEHLRVVTPALDEQSSLYLSFCPRIPSAAKARVYRADAKKVKKYSQTILETVGGIPNLSTYQFERLPASAGIFTQSPWTSILVSFDAQRRRAAAAAAAAAGPGIAFIAAPGLLGLLATQVLRCFGETVAGYDGLVRATRLLLKRDGATGAYVVRHCGDRFFLGAEADETLAERDAQSFPSVSRALPFRSLHTRLAYHHTALPPWEEEEEADDPVLEAPMYRVGESRLYTQGGPLLFKNEHEDDAEEGGGAQGGAIYLFAARGLEWGPRWAEMLGRRGLAGVAGQYKTTEARARLGLRVYGDDCTKLSGVLEKSHVRKQPMRHLLSLLQERAMGAPVTGVLQQFFTKPYSRVAAVYLYTIEQLAASALGNESAYNADLCAQWFPKSHDTMLSTLQSLHTKLMAIVEGILTDCVRKCRDADGADEHVIAKVSCSQEQAGEKGERKIEVRAWGLATEKEVREDVTDTFWMEGGERWSYRVEPSLDFD